MWETGKGRGRMILRNEVLLRGKGASRPSPAWWPQPLPTCEPEDKGNEGSWVFTLLFPACPPPLTPGPIPLNVLP